MPHAHRHKMAARKLRDYQFVDTIPEKFKCTLCKELLHYPHVTGCCGKHFCQECIEKAEKEASSPVARQSDLHKVSNARARQRKSCPSCRSTNYRHMRYLPFKRKINELKVYCLHKDNGCEKQTKLELIEEHSNDCEYQSVECPNECGEVLLRRNLITHTMNKCMLRVVPCEFCGKRGSYVSITYHHPDICPDVPLSCTNECGKTGIKRKDMDDHRTECPREMVSCTFAEVGCSSRLFREDLTDHLSQNVEVHLSLLMADHMKLKKEVERMNAREITHSTDNSNSLI